MLSSPALRFPLLVPNPSHPTSHTHTHIQNLPKISQFLLLDIIQSSPSFPLSSSKTLHTPLPTHTFKNLPKISQFLLLDVVQSRPSLPRLLINLHAFLKERVPVGNLELFLVADLFADVFGVRQTFHVMIVFLVFLLGHGFLLSSAMVKNTLKLIAICETDMFGGQESCHWLEGG